MFYVTDRGHAYWERLASKEARTEQESQRWNVMYVVENENESDSHYVDRIQEIRQQGYYNDTLEDLVGLGYVEEE